MVTHSRAKAVTSGDRPDASGAGWYNSLHMATRKSHASSNGRNGKTHVRRAPATPSRRAAPQTLEDAIVAAATSGRLSEVARAEVRAQRRAGLPITYKRGNQIVKEFPDGRREILGEIEAAPYKFPKKVARIRNG